MAKITRRFPKVQLDQRFCAEEGWRDAVGKAKGSTILTGKCKGCGVELAGAIFNVLKNTAHQNFGAPSGRPCVCRFLDKARETAAQLLDAKQRILRMEMKEEDWGNPQSQSYVYTQCGECGMECCTLVRLLETSAPACWCGNNAPWRGVQGYEHLLEIVAKYEETRFYATAFDKDWWLERVENNNSKIPMRCTLCNETVREIRLSSIQQGMSVGCKCKLHGMSTLQRWLGEALPNVKVQPECRVATNPETNRPLFVDLGLFTDATSADRDRIFLSRILEVSAASGRCPSAHIYVEF